MLAKLIKTLTHSENIYILLNTFNIYINFINFYKKTGKKQLQIFKKAFPKPLPYSFKPIGKPMKRKEW